MDCFGNEGKALTHRLYFWVATVVSNSLRDCSLGLWNLVSGKYLKVMTTHWYKLWAFKLFSATNKRLESCLGRNYLLRIISFRRDCFSCQYRALQSDCCCSLSLSVMSCATGCSTVPNLSILRAVKKSQDLKFSHIRRKKNQTIKHILVVGDSCRRVVARKNWWIMKYYGTERKYSVVLSSLKWTDACDR